MKNEELLAEGKAAGAVAVAAVHRRFSLASASFDSCDFQLISDFPRPRDFNDALDL